MEEGPVTRLAARSKVLRPAVPLLVRAATGRAVSPRVPDKASRASGPAAGASRLGRPLRNETRLRAPAWPHAARRERGRRELQTL
jgi:hypothetical protein